MINWSNENTSKSNMYILTKQCVHSWLESHFCCLAKHSLHKMRECLLQTVWEQSMQQIFPEYFDLLGHILHLCFMGTLLLSPRQLRSLDTPASWCRNLWGCCWGSWSCWGSWCYSASWCCSASWGGSSGSWRGNSASCGGSSASWGGCWGC